MAARFDLINHVASQLMFDHGVDPECWGLLMVIMEYDRQCLWWLDRQGDKQELTVPRYATDTQVQEFLHLLELRLMLMPA